MSAGLVILYQGHLTPAKAFLNSPVKGEINHDPDYNQDRG